jgi:hypothetical protein
MASETCEMPDREGGIDQKMGNGMFACRALFET